MRRRTLEAVRVTSKPPGGHCERDVRTGKPLTRGAGAHAKGRPVNGLPGGVSIEEGKEPGTPPEVSRLVADAQAGSRMAFARLYARYAGMVHSIAICRVPPEDAADVVQEVFLRALRQLKRLRNTRAFGAWLAAIARNAVLDVQRQGRGRTEVEEEPSRAGTQHDEMEARAALRAIRSLPTAYRETLMMRLVQGMTGPEIAERTGLSAASVRVNLHRGMKLLRRRLESAVRGHHDRRTARRVLVGPVRRS